MIPSIDISNKDIMKKDIGAFCCYSLVITNCNCNIKKKCIRVLHPVPLRILKIRVYLPSSHSKRQEGRGRAWIYYPTFNKLSI